MVRDKRLPQAGETIGRHDKTAISLRREVLNCWLNIARRAHGRGSYLDSKGLAASFNRAHEKFRLRRRISIKHHRDAAKARGCLLQQVEPLPAYRELISGKAREIAARMR